MIEKLKGLDNGVKIVILFFFVMALGYFVFSMIGLAFENDEEIKTKVDIDNINQYIEKETTTENPNENGSTESNNMQIDESKIVKDYSKFYTIQNAMENFVNCLISSDYAESYSVLSDEMKNKYSKSEYIEKVEKLQKENFPVDDQDHIFINSNRLVNAYQISEGEEYIIEYSNAKSNLVKFGIRLNSTKNQYTIFYIEF